METHGGFSDVRCLAVGSAAQLAAAHCPKRTDFGHSVHS